MLAPGLESKIGVIVVLKRLDKIGVEGGPSLSFDRGCFEDKLIQLISHVADCVKSTSFRWVNFFAA